jgi:uncharacterized protein YndB with AHSA1/START domain
MRCKRLPVVGEAMSKREAMAATLAFTVTRTIGVSKDGVWEVLGDFGTEHRWTKSVAHCVRDTESVRVGTVRTCTLPKPLMGRTAVREELTEYEPGSALAYRLDGPAGPFVSASSRWSMTDAVGGETLIAVEGFFTARSRGAEILVWPLVKPLLRRLTGRVVAELDAFVAARS